jgi:hypothetical protein
MGFEKEHLSFDELVNEVNRLSNAQKIELIKKIVPNTEEAVQHQELNKILDRYHDKYEQTYKDLA